MSPQSIHNYYKLLGVPRSATEAEIEDAYQRMMVTLKAAPNLPFSQDILDLARKTLLDPEKRAQYDNTLPKGIYYFEATQVFSWNQNAVAKREETSPSRSSLEDLVTPKRDPLPPPAARPQFRERGPLPSPSLQRTGSPARGHRLPPSRSSVGFQSERDSVYWIGLCLGLFSPSITIIALIVYLLAY